MWCHVQTQWRAGLDILGLDYPAVRREAAALGIRLGYGLMRKIQVLERCVLEGRGDRSSGDNEGGATDR